MTTRRPLDIDLQDVALTCFRRSAAIASALLILCTLPAVVSAQVSAAAEVSASPTKSKSTASKSAAKVASRGNTSGNAEQSIVALVNDEPITGYEIQQRAVMLSGGSVQQKAQENFKALIKKE